MFHPAGTDEVRYMRRALSRLLKNDRDPSLLFPSVSEVLKRGKKYGTYLAYLSVRINFDEGYFDVLPQYSKLVNALDFDLDGNDRKAWYMRRLLPSLVGRQNDRTSGRLLLQDTLSWMPTLWWQAMNYLVRDYIESYLDHRRPLSNIATIEDYSSESSYEINSFLREYNDLDLHILDDERGITHRYQFLQWLCAFSLPLTSDTMTYRWGNGPEREEFISLSVDDTVDTSGYLSTSILPWLTLEFSDPVQVRDDLTGAFGAVWDGAESMRRPNETFAPVETPVDWSNDRPYGMAIKIPAGTKCLYLPSTKQAEILLPDHVTLQLESQLLLPGGPDQFYRDIPFFVFVLVASPIQ